MTEPLRFSRSTRPDLGRRSSAIALGALLGLFVTLATTRAASDYCCPAPHASGVWWMVNTRGVDECGCKGAKTHPSIESRGEPDKKSGASLEESFESQLDPDDLVVIYAHGNRMETRHAEIRGQEIHNLIRQRGIPAKLIVWSWPSQPIKGLVRDSRAKAKRADCDAVLLANFIEGLPALSRVSLFGYSYGARIISGALDRVARRQVAGDTQFRAAFAAAAVDVNWLAPGNAHGHAVPRVESLLLLNNSCDRVLRRFRIVEKCYDPVALGYVGLNTSSHPNVRQHDLCCEIGKSHNECNYLNSSINVERLFDHLLWLD